MKRRVDLIGMPSDVHSSYLRGCARAPPLIRAALFCDAYSAASERGIELGAGIELNDCGDLPLEENARDDERIREAVAASACVGAVPISLGGDHSITYPILRGIHVHHGPVDILHFDAHPDLYDEYLGDKRSHASPFARIMEEGLASRLVQIGVRTLNRHQRAQAARFGVEIIEMKDFGRTPPPTFQKPLYISIDLDAFDPAFAPGVSHHEPGGLTPREVIDMLLALDCQLVGADVVEYNPTCDASGVTAILAAKLTRELSALASI
ncbi:MAG: agmatinase [Terricaulis sp.]